MGFELLLDDCVTVDSIDVIVVSFAVLVLGMGGAGRPVSAGVGVERGILCVGCVKMNT